MSYVVHMYEEHYFSIVVDNQMPDLAIYLDIFMA